MSGTPTGRGAAWFLLAAVLVATVLTGCTSAPEGSAVPSPSAAATTAVAPSPSPAATVSASPEPTPTPSAEPSAAEDPGPAAVTIDITIADGQVDPNGRKLDVAVGQPIVLDVTSDEDDEVHAHTSEDDGYTLEVKAGTKTRGEFTLTAPGSYEVESHHLGKTIVVLNAR
jgi:hypothetical protein